METKQSQQRADNKPVKPSEIEKDIKTLETARMIEQHMENLRSMRELCQEVIKDAKTATRDNVEDEEMVIMIIVDYCQNMEMTFFGKEQPGETYYYTPKTINLLGIVECNEEKEILHAYAYSGEEGGKGGNNVASLIVKHLRRDVQRQEMEAAKCSYGQLSWTEQE
jgi:hypothetical protein